MKRVALFALIAVLVAGGILFAIRRGALTPHPAVATLLPKDTVALVHLPDLNRMRDQWHDSDIYKLYQEPAMQDFLRKPMAQIPKRDTTAETLRDVEQLEIKDGFAASPRLKTRIPSCWRDFALEQSEATRKQSSANGSGKYRSLRQIGRRSSTSNTRSRSSVKGQVCWPRSTTGTGFSRRTMWISSRYCWIGLMGG